MKRKKIKYIGFYCPKGSPIKRACSPASVTKTDYILQVLKKAGADVEIISPAWIIEKPVKNAFKQTIKDTDKKIIYPPNLYASNRILRHFNMLFSLLWLFFFLLFHLKKDDWVMVYHSPYLVRIIGWIKKLKRFHLILEVEEIYTDVGNELRLKPEKELAFFSLADSYLFSTELLNKKINAQRKPFAVNYGTYQIEPLRDVPADDGKIHVVYAGTFDPRKGAETAVMTGEFLDQNYHVHILGFGSQFEIEKIKSSIAEVSKKTSATITYDGCLSGEEYVRFIQRCHIGLSTQNPDAPFNDTSFPSKVLSYLANGLRVVSVKIPVLSISKVNDLLYYYDEPTPQSIAHTIRAIDFKTPYLSREQLQLLDEEFTNTIAEWIQTSSND